MLFSSIEFTCIFQQSFLFPSGVDHSVVDKGHPLSFLVNDLPTLACYQSPSVRDLFNTRIHRAILIETDQPSVESYLTFLYNEASREAAAASTTTTTAAAATSATADAATTAAASSSAADGEVPAEVKTEEGVSEEADSEAKNGAPGPSAAAASAAPTAAVSPAPAVPTDTPIQGNPWSSLVDTLTRFLLSRPILYQSILQSNVSAVRCMMDIFLQHLIASTGQQSAVPVEEHQVSL